MKMIFIQDISDSEPRQKTITNVQGTKVCPQCKLHLSKFPDEVFINQ